MSVIGSIGTAILQGLAGGGELHDYAHAAQVFRTSNYARAPKYKFLFQVNFIVSPDAAALISAQEMSYLVKSVDLPKFTMEVKNYNQYNRKAYAQTHINYDPVTIKFHDDTANGLRELWSNYYNYYYADGNYDTVDYNYDDRYQARLHGAWGLDNGQTTPFFSAVEIYSMANGAANKITLQSPVITSFSHDNHDYAEGQALMEATMQLRYNGVTYEEGYAAGIAGFGLPSTYANALSPLVSSAIKGAVLTATNALIKPTTTFVNPIQQNRTQAAVRNAQAQAAQYNPTSSVSYSPKEIKSVIQNGSINANANNPYVFPVANSSKPVVSQNPPNVSNTSGISATSNNQVVKTPAQNNTIYPRGGIEQYLANLGYSQAQIQAALEYLRGINANVSKAAVASGQSLLTFQITAAKEFLDNPGKTSNYNKVFYGQNPSNPANIDFTNPATPVNPTYENQGWQSQLLNQGFSQSDVALAANQIKQLNVAPNTDLTNIAKKYITYAKNQPV